jgi:hypothetical protein
MAQFKLPLSGDVNQWISPITSWWSGNQISVNLVNLTQRRLRPKFFVGLVRMAYSLGK